ncbi:hypothetical protein HPB48_016195 [Haemaphysalis longicornis]|uniref:Uncharacterized protein n=1 Tax=Haemaphysalis longicornis TaxID=44386 RepID=A0A9J6FW00_HAELO|nr:hypothetical protein HPB48_016195 [Haemaphysalis longicornis]
MGNLVSRAEQMCSVQQNGTTCSSEDRKLIPRRSLQGLPQRVIYQRKGRSKTAVSRINRVFRDEGRIADAQRPGRPRLTQHIEDELIVAAVVMNPFLNASEVCDKWSLEVSTWTIRWCWQEAELSNSVAAKKAFPDCVTEAEAAVI